MFASITGSTSAKNLLPLPAELGSRLAGIASVGARKCVKFKEVSLWTSIPSRNRCVVDLRIIRQRSEEFLLGRVRLFLKAIPHLMKPGNQGTVICYRPRSAQTILAALSTPKRLPSCMDYSCAPWRPCRSWSRKLATRGFCAAMPCHGGVELRWSNMWQWSDTILHHLCFGHVL